jgi:hypothetical protein
MFSFYFIPVFVDADPYKTACIRRIAVMKIFGIRTLFLASLACESIAVPGFRPARVCFFSASLVHAQDETGTDQRRIREIMALLFQAFWNRI